MTFSNPTGASLRDNVKPPVPNIASAKERQLTMATKLEVEDIPHANVDDTQETLVPTLELALVEDLHCDDGGLFDGTF